MEDVIFLIQFLGGTHRNYVYEKTIAGEMNAGPASEGASGWAAVAKEHPEFFQVIDDGKNSTITLLAKSATGKSNLEPLPPELLSNLISIALQLHERQIRASEQHNAYLPLVAALVGGLFTLAATLLTRWLGQ
jgi:hypothetical protein